MNSEGEKVPSDQNMESESTNFLKRKINEASDLADKTQDPKKMKAEAHSMPLVKAL